MTEFGTPLKDVKDVDWLRETVDQLYQIADDISTYGDMCKDNDRQFRNLTEKRVTALCERIECDGYSLFKRDNPPQGEKE